MTLSDGRTFHYAIPDAQAFEAGYNNTYNFELQLSQGAGSNEAKRLSSSNTKRDSVSAPIYSMRTLTAGEVTRTSNENTTTETTTKPTTSTKVTISKATVSKIKARTYTGYKMKPSVTVKAGSKKLKKGTDYTVSYKNNIKVGTAKVIIKGKGSYTGTKIVTFKIKKRSKYAKGIYVVKSTGLYGHSGPRNAKKVKKNKKSSYVYSKYLKL